MTPKRKTKYYDIVRKNIQKFRKEKNLTQEKLAELIYINPTYLSQIESLKYKQADEKNNIGNLVPVSKKGNNLNQKFKNKLNYYDIARKNIKKYRKEKGITLKKLSSLSNISYYHLEHIENDKRKETFSLETLGDIADALDIDITLFFEE